jgi:glycosyltransferase involved in cell wall biosynthesis
MQPRVSIVIPFYNCAYVDQAIVSALCQTYENVEVIVIDDGSTKHRSKITPYMNLINYLGKKNGGTATALNYGMRLASGEYIAWLSSDDIFYPHKVERQLSFMQENQSLISFSAFDGINKHSQVTEYFVKTDFKNQRELFLMLAKGDPINGCTIMMHKDILSQVGFFNERLRYTHDYDMWIRVLLQRIPIHYIPEPLIQYRWHNQMGSIKHLPAIKREVRLIKGKYSKKLIRMADRM